MDYAVKISNMPIDGRKRHYIQQAVKETDGRFQTNLIESDEEQRIAVSWQSGLGYARFCRLERIINQRFF